MGLLERVGRELARLWRSGRLRHGAEVMGMRLILLEVRGGSAAGLLCRQSAELCSSAYLFKMYMQRGYSPDQPPSVRVLIAQMNTRNRAAITA